MNRASLSSSSAANNHEPPRSPRSRARSSSSFPHVAVNVEHDDDRKTWAGKAAASSAYTTSSSRRGLTSRNSSSGKRGRPRLRWILALGAAVGIWWWSRSGSNNPRELNKSPGASKSSKMETGQGPSTEQEEDIRLIARPSKNSAPDSPEQVFIRPPQPVIKRLPRIPLKSTVPGSSAIDVDVAAPPLAETLIDPAPPIDRYLAYSPHSGYHNQRISLENALTLAYMLKRTLIVPPVWVGHAIPYISFDKLNRRLEMASKVGLERCKEFGDGGSEDPIPRECVGYFGWTQLGWDFIVDLNEARKLVPMKERWNASDAWLREELGIPKSKESTEIYDLKDDMLYQYRYYDSSIDNEPLAKFENRVDVLKLARDTRDYKLVHLGTLFGTSRVRTTTDEAYEARSAFRRSLVFRNALLDEITETVRDQLGGSGNYYGLHLRVGDGMFQKSAAENMAGVWQILCVKKMKQSQALCNEISAQYRPPSSPLHARDKIGLSTEHQQWFDSPGSKPPNTALTKRKNSHTQKANTYKHAPLPKMPLVRTRADSRLVSTLKCRKALHTKSEMLVFNAPLFLATDSKLPTEDAHLAIFFGTFPCTFVLGDFSSASELNSNPVEAFNELNGLRNQDDKVPLAQFLYPQLDAQIAAWGRGMIGTPQSTYSRFAVDVLHQIYHGWEIVQRG